MTVKNLILSVFPGIDLFGRGFEAEGFQVLRGPDLLFGGDIRNFTPPRGVFEGIIGGSPCQDFSAARRAQATGYGKAMLLEFARIISIAEPEWFLLENVPRVCNFVVANFRIQRFNLDAKECGGVQRRLRCFQFGFRDGEQLWLQRLALLTDDPQRTCMATEGTKKTRRSWADYCELQGLPRTFDLPGWPIHAKYAAVGNGVPVYMARVIAAAINRRRVTMTPQLCKCNCGRPVGGRKELATAACRKRMERSRKANASDGAALGEPRSVTVTSCRAGAIDESPQLF